MKLSRLGKKQIDVLAKMASDNLVIRAITDSHDCTCEILLEDEEADNTYEIIKPKFLESLWRRELLNRSCFLPSIAVEVLTFRLKKDVVNHFSNEET